MNPKIVRDAIDALIALGEKRRDAERMVHDALNSGADASSVDNLIRAAYARPSTSNQKPSVNAQPGRFGAAYYHYTAGIGGSALANTQDQGDLLQIAKAIGPGLTPDEFNKLGAEIEKLQARRSELTNAQYQGLLWALPDKFRAERQNPIHFRPLRDDNGNPVSDSLPTPPPTPPSAGDTAQAVSIPQPSQSQQTGPVDTAPTPRPVSNQPVLPVAETIQTILQHVESQSEGQQRGGSSLDQAQSVADAIGIVDQTGITDLGNAGVSLARAFTEPNRAGEHLGNAAISAVSAIPVVGDLAKMFKYGKSAHHAVAAGKAGKAAGNVDEQAQAALTFLGSGGGGGGVVPPIAGGGSGASGGGSGGGGLGDLDGAADAVGNFGGAIENFLNKFGAAGAVVGTVGGVIVRSIGQVVEWFKTIDEGSKKMIEDNRRLAMYSGTVGAGFRDLDVGRIIRDQQAADANATALGRLTGGQNRFEQAQQDLLGPYKRIGIEFQAMRSEFGASVLKLLNSLDFVGSTLDAIYQDGKADKSARSDAERALQMLDGKMADDKVRPNAAPERPKPKPDAPKPLAVDPNRIRGWRW